MVPECSRDSQVKTGYVSIHTSLFDRLRGLLYTRPHGSKPWREWQGVRAGRACASHGGTHKREAGLDTVWVGGWARFRWKRFFVCGLARRAVSWLSAARRQLSWRQPAWGELA